MSCKKRIIHSTIIVGTCFSIGILGGCRIGSPGEERKVEEEHSTFVTLDHYNQLEKGMSYEEATEIIGSPGKAMTDEQDESTTEIYAWDGEQAKSFLSVTFKKGQLITKEQRGLQ
jgi:Domain of Unknown Function with PDB structure (DUF3862)